MKLKVYWPLSNLLNAKLNVTRKTAFTITNSVDQGKPHDFYKKHYCIVSIFYILAQFALKNKNKLPSQQGCFLWFAKSN